MSDENGAEGTATGTEGTDNQQVEESVDDLKAKLAKYQDIAKTQEKRAKDNAAAAKRLAEIEEAQKSEAQKAADRVSKAEAEVATVPAKVAAALRDHLVELHQIDKDRAELFLTATDPDLMLKQVAGLIGESGKRKPNHVPREGNSPAETTSDLREFAHNLFNGGQ